MPLSHQKIRPEHSGLGQRAPLIILTLLSLCSLAVIAGASSVAFTANGQTQTMTITSATNATVSGNGDNLTFVIMNNSVLLLSILGSGSNVLVHNGYANLTISGSNDSVTLQNSTLGNQFISGSYNKVTCLPSCRQGNLTLVSIDVSVNTTNAVVNATLHYPCSAPPSQIAPYIFSNGAWVKITPFTVNPASCTMSFTIPSSSSPADPQIAIIQSSQTTAVSNQTTVQTTVPQTQSGYPISTYVLALVIIVVILVIAWHFLSKGGKRSKK